MSRSSPEVAAPRTGNRWRLLGRIALVVAAIAFVAALAASEFVYLEETRRDFDLNSGRVRVVKRQLFRTTEEVSETWISKALEGSQPKLEADWVVTHHRGKTAWSKVCSVCTYRYAYRLTQYIESYVDLFTPKARERLARGFLAKFRGPGREDPGSSYLRAFEGEIDQAFVSWASKTPADEEWVDGFHAKHGF